MSLILDALRKSEAERRRGQAPDLYAELPPINRRARAVLQPWWWLAGALALVALLAWTVSQRSPAPMPTATTATISNVQAQRDRVDNERADAPGNASATTADVTAAVVASPPLHGQSDVVAVQPDIVTATPSRERKSNSGPAAGGTTEASAAAPLATTLPSGSSATAPAPAPAIARAPSVPPPAALAPATPLADPGTPIGLSDLSADERQQLPPLKVSMHLWDSDPAARFAIIDGSRVGEGDRIGNAFVESITRDGLVLAWNGRRLHLGIR